MVPDKTDGGTMTAERGSQDRNAVTKRKRPGMGRNMSGYGIGCRVCLGPKVLFSHPPGSEPDPPPL